MLPALRVPPRQILTKRSLPHERPCGAALRMLARPPPGESLSHEIVELGQSPSPDTAEVVPGTRDVLVQLAYDRYQAVLRAARSAPHLVPNSLRGLPRDVQVRFPAPPPELVTEEVDSLFGR